MKAFYAFPKVTTASPLQKTRAIQYEGTMKITADIIAARPSSDVNVDSPAIVHVILQSDLPRQ